MWGEFINPKALKPYNLFLTYLKALKPCNLSLTYLKKLSLYYLTIINLSLTC